MRCKDHQVLDWKQGGHKSECKGSLPTFVSSIIKKTITTYPAGTVIDMVGGTAPLRAKICKFNPPGTGRPTDPTVQEGLATYSLKSSDINEAWDEACEDVHDKQQWRKI